MFLRSKAHAQRALRQLGKSCLDVSFCSWRGGRNGRAAKKKKIADPVVLGGGGGMHYGM